MSASANSILRTPSEWQALIDPHVVIVDPDGWRSDGKPFDEPLTREDFLQRAALSTVYADQGKGPEVHELLKEFGPKSYNS